MRLDHLATAAIDQVLGRLVRRLLVVIAAAILAIVAIYQGSVAGTIWLEVRYGAVHAHAIICAIYAGLALIALIAFWAMGRKPSSSATPALSQPREMQLAMLVEAVMLGYALSRKGDRAR